MTGSTQFSVCCAILSCIATAVSVAAEPDPSRADPREPAAVIDETRSAGRSDAPAAPEVASAVEIHEYELTPLAVREEWVCETRPRYGSRIHRRYCFMRVRPPEGTPPPVTIGAGTARPDIVRGLALAEELAEGALARPMHGQRGVR